MSDSITLTLTENSLVLEAELKNFIVKLLGFTSRKLSPNEKHTSHLPVGILKVNSVRAKCNITSAAYINNQKVQTICCISVNNSINLIINKFK